MLINNSSDIKGLLLRGIVVDNKDPDNLGRVRVRVPSIHGIPGETPSWIDTDTLPWATPGIMYGIGVKCGSWNIPSVGTMVFVMFENDNINSPVYFGVCPIENNAYPIDGKPENSDCIPWIASSNEYKSIYVSSSGASLVERISDGHILYRNIDGSFMDLEDIFNKEVNL